MERIKSVYSCLFMRVRPRPELKREACILYPNAPRDARQEGPVYTCDRPRTSQISETLRVERKKVSVSRQKHRARANLASRFGSSVSAMADVDSAGLAFIAKIL